MSQLIFNIDGRVPECKARACTFKTLHSTVKTPVFMPVATVAALRSQNTADVAGLGFPVLLANTYHLLLRPGMDVFRKFSGIHRFMNWPASVLTDSGGFQVFSMSDKIRITEEGAVFRSYITGEKLVLGPETSIAIQETISSDIMMAMDQCISSTADKASCTAAADITARWAERSLRARTDPSHFLFGIIQGACFPELRKQSASQITSLPFDGFALGGLAVGEPADVRNEIMDITTDFMPEDRPRYLMGVGTPADIMDGVFRGVDMFDCILPSAMGQQGVAFTSKGRIELRRGLYKFQDRPLDENCSCPACRNYSRAYLHHLIKAGEYFGGQLAGLHNLTFYKKLMDTMRAEILKGSFIKFYRENRDIIKGDDIENPPVPQVKKEKKLPALGSYEIIRQPQGFYSIRNRNYGEVIHSVTKPDEEAKRLYADQAHMSDAAGRIQEQELVLWDVGLGGGFNAMAALSLWESYTDEQRHGKKLTVISFEKDLDSFRLAVKHPEFFTHVRHSAPSSLLKNGRWESENAEWVLKGDFLKEMDSAAQPHIIFYDPFSPASEDSPLWSADTFRRVFLRCHGRPAELFTYSNSTAVRAALLAAGFYTAEGASSGPKPDTTAAFTSHEAADPRFHLLGKAWLERLGRSQAPVPSEIRLAAEKHPQFCLREEDL